MLLWSVYVGLFRTYNINNNCNHDNNTTFFVRRFLILWYITYSHSIFKKVLLFYVLRKHSTGSSVLCLLNFFWHKSDQYTLFNIVRSVVFIVNFSVLPTLSYRVIHFIMTRVHILTPHLISRFPFQCFSRPTIWFLNPEVVQL